jgi:hypothetical protein
MLSPSPAGGWKSDGWTPRRGNRSSSIRHIGANGRGRTEIGFDVHSSFPLFFAKSFASLASSSASNLAMICRFDASVSSFSRFR